MSTDKIAEDLLATIEANRAPNPGLYKNIPMAEYHAWRAVSNSQLQHLKRSPLHLKTALETPEEPTPAMVLGSAVHCAVLEPDVFAKFYICGPEGDARTKKYQDALAEMQAMSSYPRVILRPGDYATCTGIRDAVHATSTAKRLLSGAGDIELSFAWNHVTDLPRDLDVLCKGRADRVSWDIAGGTIVDLKTCRDARKAAFERSIFGMGYYNQGAMYVDGIRAQNVGIKHYSIIAVENEPPYGVAVYRLRDEALEAGRRQNAELLARYAECTKRNEWNGYPDEVNDIGLPAWAWDAIESEIA